jgi:hypothetical protein
MSESGIASVQLLDPVALEVALIHVTSTTMKRHSLLQCTQRSDQH